MIIVIGIVLLLIVLVPTLYMWISGTKFVRKQKHIYEWHCENFFPFDKKFTDNEKKYVQKCIELSKYELFRPFLVAWDQLIERLSFFAYSHKVNKDQVNSTRIAFGSVIMPEVAESLALQVVKERGIKLPDCTKGSNLIFGGLGWDFQEKTFRVYYRFKNYSKLPKRLQKLGTDSVDWLKPGLVSWVYNDKGVIVEEKVYRYDKVEKRTQMMTSKRPKIDQFDCPVGDQYLQAKWKQRVNKTGKDIIDHYEHCGYLLDTIAFEDTDHFTLYFPMVT